MNKRNLRILLSSLTVLAACSGNDQLFHEVDPTSSGLTFTNEVTQNAGANVLSYPYYFNGGGVAIADFNNDDLPDIYFTGNMTPNKLFLNKGELRFEDITAKAGVAAPDGWKTGVTVGDVNRDGWLDLYVCRSALEAPAMRRNLLYINAGNMTFTEQGAAWGIDDDSYSTGAAFLDYDKDGDQDLFVLNHSVPRYAGFNRLLTNLKQQQEPRYQSRLYRNDEKKFTEVTKAAGITGNVLSFGLGLAVSDVNEDGWPDIYVSNDFNEEDYLFINQRDGTFQNEIRSATGHVSLFSMGSDIADINNDALPDILTLDMLPSTNERIKLSSGDDNYDKYRLLTGSGFHHQTMRNMLHLNNGDGTFSEIGQLAGISNTDWSWSAVFTDFDGDGWKDLYVANGYEKDYTNMQFLKYTVDARIKANQTGEQPSVDEIINAMPAIHVGNFVYRNNGDLTFQNVNEDWGLNRTFKSNGAAAADLDLDGDPDLVVNAMNEPAVLLENTSAKKEGNRFLRVDLRKKNSGMNIIGTKVTVYQGLTVQLQEFSPYRGFQSAMYVPLIFGTCGKPVDSIQVIWPDFQRQTIVRPEGPLVTPAYRDSKNIGTPKSTYNTLFKSENRLNWTHHPADTNDFKRQILLPRMYSYSGPRMAKADVNGDGKEDLYLCGPQHQAGSLQLQQADGTLHESNQPAFSNDKEYQDEAAVFLDCDGDGDQDLYVASGGYAFSVDDPMLQDRLYLNDGKGNFTKSKLPTESFSASSAAVFDLENDGDPDLFVGTRLIPGAWPTPPSHLLLVNDGKGNFTRASTGSAGDPALAAGMISDVIPADINKDGFTDLITVGEWSPIRVLLNQSGKLIDATGEWLNDDLTGWWNSITAADMDGDGDLDLLAGNYGLNNQYHVDAEHPATLVYKDFNNDGQTDPFFCYFVGDTSYPYASRDEALTQVTGLKPRFPDYTSYSNVTLEEIFKPEEIHDAITLTAPELRSVYLENTGTGFIVKALPMAAQFAPIHAMAIADVDGDGDQDVITGGNETYNRVRIGKCDANHGVILLNDGKGIFSTMPQRESGLKLTGDVRALTIVSGENGKVLVVGQIGQPVSTYVLRNKK